jgi:elongation factor G
VSTDQESGQTIQGTGESHLDDKIDIPKHAYRIDANITAPQVAYRETITRAATVDYTHKKQTGARRPVHADQDRRRATVAGQQLLL